MSTIYKAQGERKAKVFAGIGHGGTDPGAVGYIREEDANLNMGMGMKDYLVANNVEVCMSRIKDENDDLNEEIRECNAYDPDLALDIHNNAGKGDGFEIYHHYKGGKSLSMAKNIEAEVKKIGQNSRGCKIRKNDQGTDWYGFIRLTNAPAAIAEGVFVDNRADASQADTLAEQREFGYAYARGILKTLGLPDNGLKGSSSKPSSSSKKNVKATDGAKTFDESIAGTYKVTPNNGLNIRHGAGTDKAKMTAIPKGTKVNNYGYRTGDWLYVQFTYGGVTYTGFALKNYLKRV